MVMSTGTDTGTVTIQMDMDISTGTDTGIATGMDMDTGTHMSTDKRWQALHKGMGTHIDNMFTHVSKRTSSCQSHGLAYAHCIEVILNLSHSIASTVNYNIHRLHGFLYSAPPLAVFRSTAI
eukprot:Colp12_sorted_trinity150504_noHs@16114